MLTIFHISDLHFGESASRSSSDPKTQISQKNINGITGHDIKIWIALKNHLLSRIKQTKNEYRICVTGDLSRIGSIDSYNVASDLFFNESESDISKEFGLRIDKDKFIVVPGNHDSYDTSLHKLNNLRTFNGIFHSTTEDYPIPKIVNVDETNFIFLTVDSTYKKNGVSLLKKLGRGFVSEIQLERIRGFFLNPTTQKTVRILLLHHSPIILDGQRNRNLMLDKSQNILEAIVKNKIDIVLCGHLHEDFYDILPLKRLIKYLPKRRGWSRVLNNIYKETQLNDYYVISIKGKKARYFDSIAYQCIKDKHEILDYKKNEFKSLDHFEKYLHNLPEYKEFIQDFYNYSESETALIMAGSACKESEDANSYLELIIEDNLNQILIKRHKYNRSSNSFDTKERIKQFNKSV